MKRGHIRSDRRRSRSTSSRSTSSIPSGAVRPAMTERGGAHPSPRRRRGPNGHDESANSFRSPLCTTATATSTCVHFHSTFIHFIHNPTERKISRWSLFAMYGLQWWRCWWYQPQSAIVTMLSHQHCIQNFQILIPWFANSGFIPEISSCFLTSASNSSIMVIRKYFEE